MLVDRRARTDKKESEFLPSLKVNESVNAIFFLVWIVICWLLVCTDMKCLVRFKIPVFILVVLPYESGAGANSGKDTPIALLLI